MKIADLPQVQKLSVQDKLLLVEELWDEIAATADAIPLPEWHKHALDESLAEYRQNPREGSSPSTSKTSGRLLG
ncbi:MAG TPA: addiction module protein [Opitutales bacterium]|jgi:putative addiction module component (TIGR02574 family)|nr:addiction module protein [Opitutales bacterium]